MTAPIALSRIHHVAYRCKDAKATADWYARVLGMEFTTAFAEDHVPSTGEYDPYMHIFLDCGGGNIIAFFELPNQPEMGKDPNTPAWVQHIAFEVTDLDALLAAKAHIEAQGIDWRMAWRHGSPVGRWTQQLQGTWLLRSRQGKSDKAVLTRPSKTTWLWVSRSGLSSSGFMRTSGSARAARA